MRFTPGNNSTHMKRVLLVCNMVSLIFLSSLLENKTYAAENTDTKNSSGVTLKVNVEKQEVTLQSIRDFRLDLKRIRQAAQDIFDEVTRQPISFQAVPNVVGTVVIDLPVSIKEVGLLEPRHDWIMNGVNKMGPTIELLKKDAESIGKREARPDFSKKTDEELEKLTGNWIAQVNEMHEQYKKLLPLVKTNPYNNTAIAARSRSIFLGAKALEKTRSRAEKLVRKEIKKQRKLEKKSRS